MSEAAEGVSAPAEAKHLNVRQAAFIGVGSMVGAGDLRAPGRGRRGSGRGGVAVVPPRWGVALLQAAAVVLVTFVFTTLIHEPASIVALVVILVLSIALDYWWKRSRTSRAGHVHVAPNPVEQG